MKKTVIAAVLMAAFTPLAHAQEGSGVDPLSRFFGAFKRGSEIPLMVVTPANASGMDRTAMCWAPSLSPSSPVPCRFTGRAPAVLGFAKATAYDIGDDGSLRVLRAGDLDSKARRLHLHETLAALYLDQILAYAGRTSPERMDELLGPEDQLGVQLWSRQIYESAGGEISCPGVPVVEAVKKRYVMDPDPTILACRSALKRAKDALGAFSGVVEHIESSRGGPGHHNELEAGYIASDALDYVNAYFRAHPITQ